MTRKIPPHAQKVFSGVRTHIYQWEQEMYDGSTATFECNRLLDGAFVIAGVDGKVITTKEEQPFRGLFHGIPGGGFDSETEDPLACARRELREESGYKSDDWEHWMTSDGSSSIITHTHFFFARNAFKVGDLKLDNGEKIEIELLDFDDFLRLAEQKTTFINSALMKELLLARIYSDRYAWLHEKIFGYEKLPSEY